MRIPLFAVLALTWAGAAGRAAETAEPIEWRAWSPEAFAEAKREHKFVILDLEAVWCHWCHVQAGTTYRDPKVVELIRSRYIAVRVDQDARPDIANRYEDYGWPATVIYAPDGAELVKRQGYVPPRPMAALLQAAIDDPTPGPSVRAEAETEAASATTLGDERRERLLAAWREGYDHEHGGWGSSHKYLDWDNVELALRRATRGDCDAESYARETLSAQLALLDPVWGGVYQYSVGGNWREPHFEKLVQMQAENIRTYALAYEQFGDKRWLATAEAIHRYVRTFLTSPEGTVYVSQDADLVPGEHSAEYFARDDAGRRARGVPRIDRHVYARENGWMMAAACELAAASGDPAYRAEAERAARWAIEHRALAGGGFSHDERDAAGPYLGDTLAMGRAFLALHQLTQQPEWLQRASAAAEFIRGHFGRAAQAGFASSDTTAATFPAPRPQFDENVATARFAAALAAATGRDEFGAMAQTALRWLLAGEQAEQRGFYQGGVLLAEEEARTAPAHIMIIGAKDDATVRAMLTAALRLPTAHKLVEQWDRRAGPPPRGEDIYPPLEKPAAFVCSNGTCSTPMFNGAALEARLVKLLK